MIYRISFYFPIGRKDKDSKSKTIEELEESEY
jgi:hypothetical protein